MFEIASNNYIQVSRGESVQFNILINNGTIMNPNYLTFQGCELSVLGTSSEILVLSLDVDKWIKKNLTSGNYRFQYSEIEVSWMLGSLKVNLSDYGILYSVDPTLSLTDSSYIYLNYIAGEDHIDDIYIKFLMVGVNLDPNSVPLLEKVYYTNGKIVSKYGNPNKPNSFERLVISYKNNINSSGCFIISLDEVDTSLPGGRYLYLMKFGNYDNELKSPYQITITNKKEFNIIDDSYSDRRWTDTYSSSCLTCYLH